MTMKFAGGSRGCLPALLFGAASAAEPATTTTGFRAGAATANITPAPGTMINGGVGPGTARHIHDDRFARALVLNDGSTRLELVVVDSCVIDRPVFDEAKRLVRAQTGLPPAHVMMSCTHTHSGGAVCGAHLPMNQRVGPDRRAGRMNLVTVLVRRARRSRPTFTRVHGRDA